jgi:inner membrane protein
MNMNEYNIGKKVTNLINNSVSLKIFTIGCLIAVLWLPSSLIQSLIKEREVRKKEVIAEISSKWGNEQTIAGPILTVPYKLPQGEVGYLYFLSDELTIQGTLMPEIRYRSIYAAVLYNAKIQLQGTFNFPNSAEFNVAQQDLLWADAFMSIGISDLRGIKDKIGAQVAGSSVAMSPGIKTQAIGSSGVSVKIALSEDKTPITFRFDLNLNGSYAINFVPVGATTTVKISSNWSSPSFCGSVLPTERTITNKGFEAAWNVLQVNRDYPQAWIGNEYTVTNSSFGVKLVFPVDIYQQSTRAVKYALLFIGFTFLAFFVSEILNKNPIHPIQYLLVGFAIIVFYTLLISISEHVNFFTAYLVSGLAVTLLITAYSKAILKNLYFTLTVFGILIFLYTYLYILLQLEDYALLTGSIGFFIVLSAIMYSKTKVFVDSNTTPVYETERWYMQSSG